MIEKSVWILSLLLLYNGSARGMKILVVRERALVQNLCTFYNKPPFFLFSRCRCPQCVHRGRHVRHPCPTKDGHGKRLPRRCQQGHQSLRQVQRYATIHDIQLKWIIVKKKTGEMIDENVAWKGVIKYGVSIRCHFFKLLRYIKDQALKSTFLGNCEKHN